MTAAYSLRVSNWSKKSVFTSSPSSLIIEQQFTFARDIGAEAFPTIVYGRNGQYFPLCQGYQSYENLAHALDVLHKEPPEL